MRYIKLVQSVLGYALKLSQYLVAIGVLPQYCGLCRNGTAGQGNLDPNMLCNAIIHAAGSAVGLQEIVVNPQYFNYQTCSCETGHDAKWSSKTHLR